MIKLWYGLPQKMHHYLKTPNYNISSIQRSSSGNDKHLTLGKRISDEDCSTFKQQTFFKKTNFICLCDYTVRQLHFIIFSSFSKFVGNFGSTLFVLHQGAKNC